MKSNIAQLAATKAAQLITVFMLSTSVSMAAVTYTYIGNNYTSYTNPSIYDSTMHQELSFTMDNLLTNFAGDAALLVTSFSTFDGVNTITDTSSNPKIERLNLNTDNFGNVLQWDIYIWNANDPLTNVGDRVTYFVTRYIIGTIEQDRSTTRECISDPFGGCDIEPYYAYSNNNRGTWSVTPSTVPVPPALWLFGSGLLGLVGIARKKAA